MKVYKLDYVIFLTNSDDWKCLLSLTLPNQSQIGTDVEVVPWEIVFLKIFLKLRVHVNPIPLYMRGESQYGLRDQN